MHKILLIEDSLDTRNLVKRILGNEYQIFDVDSIKAAKQAIENETFDLIILDLNLPDGKGVELCSRIRQEGIAPETGILVLSAKQEKEAIVFALYAGADDYLSKPFDGNELKARVMARIREKRRQESDSVLSVGGVQLDIGMQRAAIEENGVLRDIGLTPIEFKILHTLLRQPNVPFTRERLVRVVWFNSPFVEARGIDAHLSRLRRKLGERASLISSVYGVGYVFKKAG
jgi:DNA-binding response OmpR family regulator